jgi:hypothetical protein
VVTGTNMGAAEVQKLVEAHFTMNIVESLDLVSGEEIVVVVVVVVVVCSSV